MPTVILCLVLFCILIFSVKSFARKLSSGCCGGGDVPHRNPVKDKIKRHYPFAATIEIGGMSCQNCAIHVENALNGLEGVWAKVSLEKQAATVLMKARLSDEQLTCPVVSAGYAVRGIRRNHGKP